ncbi:YlbF family regulator [Chloroflexota bacterium]
METIINELEIASPSVIRQAARDFAAALSETPQFKAYEEFSIQLRGDTAAQKTIHAYQEKQRSLQTLLMLHAVPPQEQAELERLKQDYLAQPVVKAFLKAQEDLIVLCQTATDLLGQHIGLSFTAACGSGCC